MATENPVESLQEEATCPICLEYFKAPVILDCGHNFCRLCVTQCWQGSDANFSCPQCREILQHRNFRPNRQLANVVELAKQLRLQAAKGVEGERVCEIHGEELKLFCEEDQTPICLVCDRSKEHRAHTVVPIEEAAQEYKKKIQTHLMSLKKEREKLQEIKVTDTQRSWEHLKQIEAERLKIMSEFEQLHQFLREQEQLLLARLAELDQEIVKLQDENVTKLSKEISRLSEQISELEGKCRQPASEFLQDIRSTMNRSEEEKFQQLLEASSDLERSLSHFCQKNIAVKLTLNKLKDSLPLELKTGKGKSMGSDGKGTFPASVTLDRDTAHPRLLLSVDRKILTWNVIRLNRPEHPQRFDSSPCVLGCEGFTTGRHCWEVEVGNGTAWAVGVARESVKRKEELSAAPERGIWAVQRWGFQFQALSSPPTPLSLSCVPSRIRVSLDCEQGQVAFFNAGSEAPIFTFPPTSFTGERIYPFFWVWGVGSQLTLYS
ncbi:E3 ubiquitin-protein ligase TRIM39 isoform X1 [Chelonia mydas]|uniref:E3 ubiquitin-protein ligase TRIM39 isoform X1 n=1 Tax=Chelonia mydas TaxID=8469 RepID=UPI0018A225DD|nr:E3 ubiquitin-protein ligase TRIM39 isoform X1 [Chelonia mydas]